MKVAYYYLSGGLVAILVTAITHAEPTVMAAAMLVGAVVVWLLERK